MSAPIPAWPGELVSLGDMEIFVRTAPARKPDAEPAVFVHGLAGSASNWTDLMGLLNTVLRWFGRGYSAASTIAAAEFNQEARVAAYGVREAFYDNSIYLPQAQGG